MDTDAQEITILPTMAKRKPAGGKKMPTKTDTVAPIERPGDKVGFTVYTTRAVLEAIEAFLEDYNREHPGANLKRTRAADILLRESLRNRKHLSEDSPQTPQD